MRKPIISQNEIGARKVDTVITAVADKKTKKFV